MGVSQQLLAPDFSKNAQDIVAENFPYSLSVISPYQQFLSKVGQVGYFAQAVNSRESNLFGHIPFFYRVCSMPVRSAMKSVPTATWSIPATATR